MKQTNFISLILVFVTLVCSTQTWAGGSYYKNLSFTVKNPETAKGRVYLTPHNSSDTAYCTISKDPKVAKVEGNFSNSGTYFKANMFVFPADGYVLDCLTTPKAYANGDYRSECVRNTEGYPISSSPLIIDPDTTANCTTSRPAEGAYLKPVSVYEFYAVFVPSKRASIRNNKAGSVSNAVRACQYGEAANDLRITGPINKADLKYLNQLSQKKGLIRLDLSGASFTTVPDSAFYNSGLYELKLPSGIEAVGNYAFANSMGLKPVKLPAGIVKGKNTISGCSLMNILGIKEETSPLSSDYLWLYNLLFSPFD